MKVTEIAQSDAAYPELLRHIHEPPAKLYVRGMLPAENAPCIAIVGSRKCTPYGKQAAYDLAYALAKAGVTVVSGMALGIDGEAHLGALDAGGRTIAVLGTGVNDASLYPHSHIELARRIMEQGAVISEYEPGTPAYPNQFPERNRIVSGLSRGVIIVEADLRSGSLITARLALEQGRDVFAVPGPIYSRTSQGTHALIQEGAKLVAKAEDILQDWGLSGAASAAEDATLSDEERAVLAAVSAGPAHTDALIAQLDLPSHAVLSLLSILELKRKVQHIGNNTYVVKD